MLSVLDIHWSEGGVFLLKNICRIPGREFVCAMDRDILLKYEYILRFNHHKV